MLRRNTHKAKPSIRLSRHKDSIFKTAPGTTIRVLIKVSE